MPKKQSVDDFITPERIARILRHKAPLVDLRKPMGTTKVDLQVKDKSIPLWVGSVEVGGSLLIVISRRKPKGLTHEGKQQQNSGDPRSLGIDGCSKRRDD